ncbi:4'-phosphopantetheinyl transferase family protein, partial [Frankia canadensis]|uniref:4'-phosphopantetheinyl transferase family protein n=1 Tax=Frankia canadensis TaxID=1836972 RepID=UPI001403E956
MPASRSDFPVAATRTISAASPAPDDVVPAGRPPLECHLLSFADLVPAAPVGEYGPPKSLVKRLGRLLLATVLAEHLGVPSPGDVPLRDSADGRPVLAGEAAAGARAGLSHDRGMLVVGFHPDGCAVDVEDTPVALIAEVAGRFCGADERLRLPTGAAVRGLWSAKEAVAKYTGLGLRAGLREITFDGDPQADWVRSCYPGAACAPLCRVVAMPGRHLAFAVGPGGEPGVGSAPSGAVDAVAVGRTPCAVEVHRWTPTAWSWSDGDPRPDRLARVDLEPAGELADLARAVAAAAPPTHAAPSTSGEPPTRTTPPTRATPPTHTTSPTRTTSHGYTEPPTRTVPP